MKTITSVEQIKELKSSDLAYLEVFHFKKKEENNMVTLVTYSTRLDEMKEKLKFMFEKQPTYIFKFPFYSLAMGRYIFEYLVPQENDEL